MDKSQAKPPQPDGSLSYKMEDGSTINVLIFFNHKTTKTIEEILLKIIQYEQQNAK